MRRRILSLALTIAMMVSMLHMGMIPASAATVVLPLTSVDNSNRPYIPGFYVAHGDKLNYDGTGVLNFTGGLQAGGIGGKGVSLGSGNVAADSLCGDMTFGKVGEKGNFTVIASGGTWAAGIGDGDASREYPVSDKQRTITVNSGILIGYAGAAAGIGTQDELPNTQMILDFKNSTEGSFAVGASSGACGVGAGNTSTMRSGNLKIAGYVMGLTAGGKFPISEQNYSQSAAIDPGWTIYTYNLTGGVGAGSRIYITKEGCNVPVYDYVIPVGYTKLAMSFKVGALYGGTYKIMFGDKGYKIIDTINTIGGGFFNETITPSSLGYATSVSLGSNMSLDTGSGALSQGGNAGTAITPIKIKANSGYELPANWAVGNGLTYIRNTSTTATITGNLQSTNVVVTVPNAIEKLTYTVNFNSNGGSGTMSSQTFTVEVAQNLIANSFTSSGNTFAGWNTQANGNGTSYADCASYTATASTTLYAVWKSNACDITAFNFASPAVTGIINDTDVALNVPFGTDVTALLPTITVSTGASVSPVSGKAQNFTNPITYTVTAADGTTNRAYTVTVTIAADPDIAIVNDAKVAAKLELENYKDAADYTANVSALTAAIAAGETNITAATDLSGVSTALANAKSVIDGIKSDSVLAAEALVIAKTNAKSELDSYVNAGDYTTNASALAAAIAAGETNITAATDLSGVSIALANAKSVIDGIESDSEITARELATAKTNAKSELDSYVNAGDYTTNVSALTAAIAAGETNITAATDLSGVSIALANAKSVIDGIESDSEITARELATAKTNAKSELDSYVNAGNYETNADALADKIAAGKLAIDAATTTVEVETALANVKLVIDGIKSDSVLAAEALVIAKTNAKSELGSYVNAGDYTTNASALTAAIAAGETNITAATDLSGVSIALANAKSVIDGIKSDSVLAAEALVIAKTNAKSELDSYVNAGDYTTNVSALTAAIAAGETNITAATDLSGVSIALANAKSVIDGIESDSEITARELATAKTNAKSELDSYVNAGDYTTNASALTAAIAAGETNITAATDLSGVSTALANAKSVIDGIESDSEITARELATAKTNAKSELDSYINAGNYETNADALADKIAAGKLAIDAATTTVEVETALANVKLVIDGIKSDSVLAAEALVIAKTNAKSELGSYVNAGDYTTNVSALTAAIAAGETNITAATDLSGVSIALANAKSVIDGIKSDSVLAAEALVIAKTNAKSELDSYVNAGDYTANASALAAAIAAGETNITAATDLSGVSIALANAKSVIDGIKSDSVLAAEALVIAKTNAKSELDSYVNAGDYTANASALAAAIAAGETNITAATDLSGVSIALANAKSVIDGIKSDSVLAAEALVIAKTNAKSELDSYVNAGDYTANASALAAAIAAGETNITAATDLSGVSIALANAKSVIDGIKSDSVLAAEALVIAKTNAKSELDSYVNAGDYTTNVSALTAAIAAGETNITAATDLSGVSIALANAKSVIDGIESDSEITARELATAKTNAKSELDSYVNAGDYTTNASALTAAIAAGETNITAATDLSGVSTALANAKSVIDGIESDSEITARELATAKTNAKSELDSYVNAGNYTTNASALTAAIAAGETNITAATDLSGVSIALANAKSVIDGIKSDSEITARELATAKTNAKSELDSYVNAGNYETNADALADKIAAGKLAIDAATTTVEVETALANVKLVIDGIKSDSVLAAEALVIAKTNAKSELGSYVNAGDYTTNVSALTAAIAAGETNITAATDLSGVSIALANAKSVIDGIESDSEITARELATAKTNAKSELDSYVNAGDYTTNASALTAAIAAGETNITAATDLSGVSTALANAKSVIDGIESDSEITARELATAKTNAKSELDSYVNAGNYETNADALADKIAAGKLAIDAATTTVEVETALANAKSVIDGIKSDSVLAAEALVIAKTNAKSELDSYVNAGDYTTNASALTAAIAAGETNITAATDLSGVSTALANAKSVIDGIKSDSVMAAEALAIAETSKTDATRTAAQDLVTALPDGEEKTALQERLAAIVTAEDKAAALQSATNSVATAEISKTDATRTAAQDLVTALPDGAEKTALQERLAGIVTAEDKVAEDEVATRLLEAKNTAENIIYPYMAQELATNKVVIKNALKLTADTAINDNSVLTTINEVSYTLPTAGILATNQVGKNGSYVFTVTVSKDNQTQTTTQKTIIITAASYQEIPTYSVIGAVYGDSNNPAMDASVKLMKGNLQIGTQGVTTDQKGEFTIMGAPNGTFNLVVVSVGGVTVTKKVEIADENYIFSSIITLPTGQTNSVLDVRPGSPDVVVGNLDNQFDDADIIQAQIANNAVEIKLVAEGKAIEAVREDATKIAAVTSNKTMGLYLDLSVIKKTTVNGSVYAETQMPTLPSIIEIIIPLSLELQGKEEITVYRVHNGMAEAMQENTADANGEYFVVAGDVVIIYTKSFSIYAIGYKTPKINHNSGSVSSSPVPETITAEPDKGGNIMISKDKRMATINPDDGYVIVDVEVDGNSLGAINQYNFTDNNTHEIKALFVKATALPYYLQDGKKVYIGFSGIVGNLYKSITPAGVKVEFGENQKNFTDNTLAWAKSSIDFVAEREIFLGTERDKFSPNESMTRGMFVTVIGRLYERSFGSISGASTFSDVNANSYYAKYVGWANENGIIKGVGDNKFAPNDKVTREQMAVIMLNFATFLKKTAIVDDSLGYTDCATISSWAIDGAKYCQTTKVITGRMGGEFAPQESATRAEVAVVIDRFIKTIVK